MDVLSDVIGTLRIGRPHSARAVHRAPFARQFPLFDGAGFHILLQGSAWLLPEAGQPLAMTTGDVVFLPHGSAHGLAQDGRSGAAAEMLCGAYFLDLRQTHPLLAQLPEVVHLPARIGRHPQLNAAVELLGHELREPGRGSETAIGAVLDLLLLYMLRSWFADGQHETADTGWPAALRDPWVSHALEGIHAQPGHSWTVEGLAAEAALSRSAFSRRFTALVGRPPLAYVTWWRMKLAARLLATSEAPLAAVAEQVGYGSEFAFAHAFKREHGQAPGRYRRDRTAAPS